MTRGIFERFRHLVSDWLCRVRRAWMWIVLEIVGVALLIALGLMWTRIPEKHGWQVLLTLLVPVVIVAGFVVLQAGTVRGFLRPVAEEDRGNRTRVSLAWGAATLMIWIAIGWVLWTLLDKFDDKVWSWASYLNSRFGANARAQWASFEHLSRDLNWTAWTLRWVVVPGVLMPLACSAAGGLRRLPWGRVLRLYINWRWWPAVLACALVGEAWPQRWFGGEPHGSVHEQVTRVMLKLVAAYLLAMVCWVKLLGWTAMLLDEAPWAGDDDGEEPVPEPAIVSGPGEKHAGVQLPLPDTEKSVGGDA
jgi:hypothetical protein